MPDSQRLKLKKLFLFCLIHEANAFLGGLLFIYLEECRPGQVRTSSKTIELKKFQAFLKNDVNVTSTERDFILNKTIGFFMKERQLTCAINQSTLLRWWSFTSVTLYTIGYGWTTPETDAGKIALIIYAIIGIPLTVVFYSLLGDTITIIIARMIHSFEQRLLERRRVQQLQIKVFLISSLANLVFLNLSCILTSILATPRLSFVDSIYYWFQTITTIGYGDVYPHFSDEASLKLHFITSLVVIISTLGLGLTASLIASVVKYLQSLKAKKLRVMLSSLSRRTKKSDKNSSRETISTTSTTNMTTMFSSNQENLGERSREKQNQTCSAFSLKQ